MRIEYYYKDGVLGCCPLQVYAVLRTESFTALKDDGVGNKALDTYVASDEDFAIVLAEHAQLSKLYYIDIPDEDVVLAATPTGEKYYLEFWLAADPGTYDRATDTLLDTQAFIWGGTTYATTYNEVANGEVIIGIAYDSVTHIQHFMASLMKNGQHVTNPTACSFKLVNGDDEVLAESEPMSALGEIAGVYAWQEPGQDPDADRVYAVIVTITHDGVDYSSVSYQINWD